MSEFRLNHIVRFAGIAFVVLAVVGFIGAGDVGLEDGAKIATHFAAHRDRILICYHIAAIGCLAFLSWAWWLMMVIEQRDSSSRHLALAVFVSAALLVAVEFGAIALTLALAFIADQPVDPQIARAFASGAQVFSDVEYFPQALFFLALGLAILRTHLAGSWLGWSALALVPGSLIAGAPSLGIDLPVALVTFGWIVVGSIVMIRASGIAAAK